MPVPNPFGSEVAARRYAAGRLDVHAEFVRRIVGGLGGRARRVLDVGCGTGLSTAPLARAFGFAVGLDVASPMLAEARRGGLPRLVRGLGERLPFPAASFDLLAMGCSFHWCEPGPLGAEIRRVLAPRGHLAVFDHCMAGRIEGEPGFAAWFDAYRKRFPAPPRHPHFDPGREEGFLPVAHETIEHAVGLPLDALAAYITSQSNVLGAVASGVPMAEIEAEVRAGLAPFFRGRATAAVAYRGELDLLRKARGSGVARACRGP